MRFISPVVPLVVLLAVGAGVLALTYMPSATATPAPNAMAVDAVSGGAVDSSRTVTGAVEFDMGVNVTAAPTPYATYQARIEYDSAVINFVPVTLTEAGAVVDAPNGECSDGIDNDGDGNTDDDPECALAGMNVRYLPVGDLTAASAVAVDHPATGTLRRTSMGSTRASGTTSYVGQVVLARYRCVGNGTTSLHLVSSADDAGYSSTWGPGGDTIPTELADATVICEDIGATPTPAPTATLAPPTLTPVPGAGNAMAVDAVSGGTVNATRTVLDTSQFSVDIAITAADVRYAGYQFILQWDPAVLALDRHTPLNPGGVFTLCLPATVWADTAMAGCARFSGTTSFTGAVDTLTFHCMANALDSPLHLVAPTGTLSNTTTLAAGGVLIPTTLADATITCQGLPGTAVPTRTPTPAATATNTRTPTRTVTATRTSSNTSGPATGTSSNTSGPLEIGLSLDPVGSFSPQTGAATVSGLVTCSAPAWVDLSGEVRQRVGRAVISGSFYQWLYCEDQIRWSAQVDDQNGRYAGGPADVSVAAYAFAPDASDAAAASATVRLKGSPPLRFCPRQGNDGFEAGPVDTNDIPCWTVVDRGSGSWCNQTGRLPPQGACAGDSVPVAAPPEASQAVMTNQPGPGSHVLYRCGVLRSGDITFELYLNNEAGEFLSPPLLDHETTGNQQFRADLVTAAAMEADPFTVAPDDVVLNIYQTLPGDAAVSGYVAIVTDASAHVRQEVCLRFAEVDNQYFFHAGIDDVNLDLRERGGQSGG